MFVLLADTAGLCSTECLYLSVKLRIVISLHRSALDLPIFLPYLLLPLVHRCHFDIVINVVIHRLERVGTHLGILDSEEIANLSKLTGMVIIPGPRKVLPSSRPLFDRVRIQNCWL